MRGMILAAGEGRRMQPLTAAAAKPSLPVFGTPLVAHPARLLAACGVTEIAVNLYHQGATVQRALEREAGSGTAPGALSGLRFHWSVEETLLGTAGGVGRVRGWLAAEGTTVVANSDFLSDLDLAPLLQFHREKGALATLVVMDRFGPFPGEIHVDPAGRVTAIEAPGAFEFTGVQVLEPALLERFPDRRADSVRDVYRPGLSEGRIFAWRHGGWWWEFGRLDRFLEGHRLLMSEGRALERGTLENRADGTVWLGAGASVSPGASIRGSVVLGSEARALVGSELEDCVVLPRAQIAPYCRLRRCIVAPDTVLTGGTVLEGVAVASSPCGAPSGLAAAAETARGRPAPPEECRNEFDLWVRPIA